MKKYRCTVCDWIYDPEVGDPDGGIAPGTAFEDIPDDWSCPLCGVTKEDFELVEEQIILVSFVNQIHIVFINENGSEIHSHFY